MDSIKKLEEINKVTEGLFKSASGYLTRNRKGGYFLNNNPVDGMFGDGLFSPVTWSNPGLAWLINSKFDADFITLVAGNRVKMNGIWNEGTFEGESFAGTFNNGTFRGKTFSGTFKNGIFEGNSFEGTQSVFENGEFRGNIYNAGNVGFFRATPDKYFKGLWINHQNGILGIDLIKEPIENTVENIELAAVPDGWFVTLIGDKGKKLIFKVIKKIDDKSTDFVFEIYPSLAKLKVLWETIRVDYINNGHINKGRQFGLLGQQYLITNITSIVVSNEQPNVIVNAQNTIDFSKDKRLNKFFLYGKNPLKFQVSTNSPDAVEKIQGIQKFIDSGGFYNGLNRLKFLIQNKSIDGYNNEKWEFLKPVFNNVIGIKPATDKKVLEFMKYLNYIISIVTLNSKLLLKEYKTNSIFIGILKKFLETDKYINSSEEKTANTAKINNKNVKGKTTKTGVNNTAWDVGDSSQDKKDKFIQQTQKARTQSQTLLGKV